MTGAIKYRYWNGSQGKMVLEAFQLQFFGPEIFDCLDDFEHILIPNDEIWHQG